MRTIVGLALAALVVMPAPAGRAQQEQRPMFRGSAAFVYVDVYPRRDGQPVTGLTAADFQVFEDGTPQQLETFEFIEFETNPADAVRRDPGSLADSERQAADPSNRVFVVYLDLYHTTISGSHAAQRPVVDFLNRTIGVTDLFAVVTPEEPLSRLTFGRRTETIEEELREFWFWGEADRQTVTPRTEIERRLAECALANDVDEALVIGVHREDALFTHLESLMDRLYGLREERKNILFISEGWTPRGAQANLANMARSGVPQVGVSPGGEFGRLGRQQGSIDDSWCSQQFSRLAAIEFEIRFRELLRRARQSNVSFYPLDVGGLHVNPIGRNRETLLELAENTDGMAIVDTNDLAGGVRKITDSLSGYYLLGYYSSNSRADGRYRDIRVEVRTPEVDVAARPGYFAPTEAMVAAASRPPVEASPVDEALALLARARPEAAIHSHGVRSGDRLRIAVELGASSLQSFRNGADLTVTLPTAGGEASPVLTVNGTLAAGARSALIDVPAAELGPGPWRVDIRAVAATPSGRGSGARAGGGAAGDSRLDSRLDIAPVEGDAIFGQPLAYRATPSPRSTPRPVADFQYRRTERIHVELPVLRALDTHQARLLDRQGQPLPVAPTVSGPVTGSEPMLALDLNLSPLSDGEYVLEVTGTSGSDTARRLVAFRVTR
jgi:VWFA-related protein